MDGEAIGLGTVGTVAPQDGYKTFRINAKSPSQNFSKGYKAFAT
jgi:hypothetical protein